ncbi:MAG: TusE/DsrC/DsvC family sulfur relay protein [Burkholderiales bacterium]|nr:TusE/DsrC/DsvC family sulfur relay protein [Burkholderiales bacterium]
MPIEVNGKSYETDEEGYLVNLAEWDEDIGKALAEGENIEMTPQHWEVVNFLRDYYNEFQIAPAVRVLTKSIGKKLGPEKGNSQYLYELFPYGPAKQACKIAGLPKPTGCI